MLMLQEKHRLPQDLSPLPQDRVWQLENLLITCYEDKLSISPLVSPELIKTEWLVQDARINLINELLGNT
jgi:hypothetical protein